MLGFVGLPYTLATYLVEGGTSKEYLEIKKMMYSQPQILHKMLEVAPRSRAASAVLRRPPHARQPRTAPHARR